MKLNPILIWHEREVWQYIALHQVAVNPLYTQGYRSLGCAPCTRISSGPDERSRPLGGHQQMRWRVRHPHTPSEDGRRT